MEDELAFLYEAPLPQGSSALQAPAANDAFAYTKGRAVSFWPTVNGNNATFFEDDVRPLYENGPTADLTFKGKLVNLMHEIGPNSRSMVIGSIYDEAYIPGVGIDVINRIDRRQLEKYDVPAEELAGTGEYSKQSVEIRCDRNQSRYIVMKNPSSKRIEDQQVFSADEAAALGIRRTMVTDPLGTYLHNGYEVVEACIPQVVRGIAMLGNPAEKTAVTYELAASQDDPFDGISGYDNVDPTSINDSEAMALPDDAFAVVNARTEVSSQGAGQQKTRELPLYKTPGDHKGEQPHKGLVRAAMDALRNPKHGYSKEVHAVAVQRIKNAHNQLQKTGAKMTAEEQAALTDPLKNEIDTLKSKIATAADEKAALEENAKLKEKAKDDEIAALKQELDDLKAKIADRDATEIASQRLTLLKGMKGFEVKADEEAALIETLKSESEDAFKIRKLTTENALLRAGHKPEENAGKSEDEIAGLKALNGSKKIGDTKNVLAALLA